MPSTSATAVLSMLEEGDSYMKGAALRGMDHLMDEHWPEFAESDLIRKLEMLHESTEYDVQDRQLAALVAAKIYYHLNVIDEAVSCALGAGNLLDVGDRSEFVRTVLGRCLDMYIRHRQDVVDRRGSPQVDGEKNEKAFDTRLEKLVNRLIQRCFDHKKYQQAVGIALEARRLDIFEKAIVESRDTRSMLSYSLRVAMTLVQNRHFRSEVFDKLVELYRNLEAPDLIHLFQCLIFMDRSDEAAVVLLKLLDSRQEEQQLMAYQLAFDLCDNATQQFRLRVLDSVKMNIGETVTVPGAAASASKPDGLDSGAAAAAVGGQSLAAQGEAPLTPQLAPSSNAISTTTPSSNVAVNDKHAKLKHILTGDLSISLNLQFLIRNNHADLKLLKHMKDMVRNSVSHNATVIANAFMHCGTTSDTFLRDNLDWLARATNWAKFVATASLGVMHRGHEKDAVKVMSTYLPKDAGAGSYAEGGGLYALGLIHANHGSEEIINYMKAQLQAANNEMLRHGGCLGLGLAAMTTGRQDVYQVLRDNLFQDDAVTGEAAAMSMGLVMMGTANGQGLSQKQAIEDMVQYAHETQHEKILRGLATGIALLMYERLEEADTLIAQLLLEKDAILRRAGVFTISLAYCGTGNNAAIRRLLHIAVSDTDNDVRRAAVMGIGFLLFSEPERCPTAVELLSESYNPHVRYGAAMALAVACAGTGLKDALRILEPMMSDSVNYVRQGAYIASSIILMQQNTQTCPKSKDFVARYRKAIDDKHEDVIAKFGAIIAHGIIDAGGKNCTISMQTRTGHTSLPAVVGLFVCAQFWYWFPLIHFLALALTPTSLIGLNKDLQMPKLQFRSQAPPKKFAYTPPMADNKEKKKDNVEVAVLSITAKQRKKEQLKKMRESKSTDDRMDVDQPSEETVGISAGTKPTAGADSTAADDAEMKDVFADAPMKAGDKTAKTGTDVAVEDEDDKRDHILIDNPARVMNAQLRVMHVESKRYKPIKPVSTGGIVVMLDLKPSEQVEIVEEMKPTQPVGEGEDAKEPEAPEPFEWTEDDDQALNEEAERLAKQTAEEQAKLDELKKERENKGGKGGGAGGTTGGRNRKPL